MVEFHHNCCMGPITHLMYKVLTQKILTREEIKEHLDTINEQNLEGETALILASKFAATYSSLETMQLLILNGADINISDKYGFTPLMHACMQTSQERGTSTIDAVELLLNAHPKFNVKDKKGNTELILAVTASSTTGSHETVKLLLECGARIDEGNNDGKTALIVCIMHGTYETTRLLLRSGTGSNIKDKSGWSPLMFATNYRTYEFVKLLVDYGANIGAREWDIALQELLYSKNLAIIKLFADVGATIPVHALKFVLAAAYDPDDTPKQNILETADIVTIEKQFFENRAKFVDIIGILNKDAIKYFTARYYTIVSRHTSAGLVTRICHQRFKNLANGKIGEVISFPNY